MSSSAETMRVPGHIGRNALNMTDEELLDWYALLVRAAVTERWHKPKPPMVVVDEVDSPDTPVKPSTEPPTIAQIREAYAVANEEEGPPTIEGESRLHRAAHKLGLAHR